MSARATAFGLDLSGPALPVLAGATARATGRVTRLSVERERSAGEPRPGVERLICDERDRAGSPIFQIHADADAGYRISGPAYGDFLLSADGRSIRCLPGRAEEAAWQRLLVAQVLPFASLLQGLEVLHASAVVIDGEAVAVLGPSGAGKTSLALALCERGARFLADDVLAVERSPSGDLLAHAGTAFAAVAPGAAGGDCEPAKGLLAAPAASEQPAGAGPPRLGALFFLERRADGPETPATRPVGDPRMLLGATFNLVLSTPERLRRLLDVSAAAARLRTESILAASRTPPATLAAGVEARLALQTAGA